MSRMNETERVRNAFQGKAVDRPPVGFWFHFPPEQALGQPCVDAHLRYYNHSRVDIVKIMCDGYFTYPDLESVSCANDLYDLKPLGKDHPFIREQVDRVKAVREGLTRDLCTFYNVFAPFSSIRFGSSDEFVMNCIREDPNAVKHALSVISETNSLLAELCVTEGGCEGIYYCVQGGEKERFTPEQYREWITPSDRAVLEHVNRFTPNNMLHCCGWAGIQNNLSVWQDYPAAVFNWACFIEGVSVPEGKRFFGGKPVLAGFDNRPGGVLYSGSKAEVQSFTRELIASMEGQTGFLIGADCTLPAGIDPARFDWVAEAAEACAKA